jgi:signal transduction histidine kinase
LEPTLLNGGNVAKRRIVKPRLISIVLLGIVLSALSLIALVRVLSVTTAQRLERGREAVRDEVERLAAGGASARAALEAPEGTTMIGMRAGVGPAAIAVLPDGWRQAVTSARDRSAASGAPALVEGPLGRGTLVTVARPAAEGGYAWAAYLVAPPTYLRTWQAIVIGLALATALLVATGFFALVTFQRSTAALSQSLRELAGNLAAPIPRPSIGELGVVADGIARLAKDLERSRARQEQLGRELAQQERLAALGRVVAGVAHEVRNPLASIKLHLDLAAAGTTLPPPVERAVTHASSEIQRLDRLVADLLAVTGLHLGPFREVSIGELLRARADALLPWAESRRVRIEVAGDARAPVDADAVARAVDNLLRNAVEAAPPGSAVEVGVGAEDGAVSVCVVDRGGGVAPERSAELFEPFFTTKPDGTGLGLAISRAIARAHGGELSYARRADTTRFTLSLAQHATAAVEEARA